MGSVSATPDSAVEVLGHGASSPFSGSGTSSLEASLLFFFFLGGPAGSSPSVISAISSASSSRGHLEPREEDAGVPPEAPVGCTAPTKLGRDTGSPCGRPQPEPGSSPEVWLRTAAWFPAVMSCRAFSCRFCISKMRWDACILQEFSFFPKERLSGTGAALMGVLVTRGVMSVGSPSPVRSYVSAQLWKTAHLERAGGIPRGRAPSEAVLRVADALWDNLFCSLGSVTAGVSGMRYHTGLPHCRVSGGCGCSGASSIHTSSSNAGDDPTHALPEGLLNPVGEGIFCGDVCTVYGRLLRRVYVSMYWESFTHLRLMRGWNR